MARIAVTTDAAFGADAARWLSAGSGDISGANDADAVVAALNALGHRAHRLELDRHAATALPRALARRPVDLVFNLCDLLGARSDRAVLVPALLEALGVPFAGPSASGLCLNKRKHDVKAILVREGVPTPRYQLIADAAALRRFRLELQPPVIVKPTFEHGSTGITLRSACFTQAEVKRQAARLLTQLRQPLLVEEFVGGREYYQSFCGDPPQPLSLIERSLRQLPKGHPPYFTFELKWAPSRARRRAADPRWRRPVPRRQSAGPCERPTSTAAVQALLRRAFVSAGGRDWGRVELRLDASGLPLVIDVTTCSYLGANGQESLAARHGGKSYPQLIEAIVEGALRRARGLR